VQDFALLAVTDGTSVTPDFLQLGGTPTYMAVDYQTKPKTFQCCTGL